MKADTFHIEAGKGIVSATGKVATASENPYLLDILNRRSRGGEWRAVRRVLNLLQRDGFTLVGVWDGDTLETVGSTLEALAVIFNLDEASIRVQRGDGPTHGILIVLGNDPTGDEVVADWTYSDGDADGFDAAMNRITGYGQ